MSAHDARHASQARDDAHPALTEASSRDVDLAAPVGTRDHVDGPADAAVTLVVYGDYECPHTRAAHLAVRRAQRGLRDGAGPTLRYAFRHFPLTEIHPHAAHAAQAAEAAAAAGQFWPMHDDLFAHQNALDDVALVSYAEAHGVSGGSVREAIAQGTYDGRIEQDIESGVASGVRGTPSLFLNDMRYRGEREPAALIAAIRTAADRPDPLAPRESRA